jgi:pimeloyl-ACP methyl ester carboxylesterase
MKTRLAALFLAVIFAPTVLADDTSSKAVKKTIRAADGVNIACEIRGKGDTALVFLHGWCGDHEYWKHQVEPFSADYRVVTLDQAGHGDSGKDRKKWTVDSLAGDVETVVKQLGLKRVILIGHSMGGPVSLAAAKRMPGTVVAVIGVDTLQNAERKMPEEQAKQFFEMFENDFQGTVKNMMPGLLTKNVDPEIVKWIVSRAANQDKTMAVGLMRDMMPLDQSKLLKEAKVPVRCINSSGGFQFFTPTATDINKKYADYEVVVIDDVGHYPMLEKPEEFNKKLKDVLKEFAGKK